MPTNSNQARYPLAYDASGSPIEVPEMAVGWRVRRGGGKRGRPRIVFDSETGRQMEVPIEATIDDLVDYGCTPGRYRLEAVDRNGRIIPGCVAITEITDEAAEGDVEMVGGDATVLARLLQTIERQSEIQCQSLQALSSAFGPVAALGPQQHPLVISQGGGNAGMQPEQIAQLIQQGALAAKMLVDAWKGGGGGGNGGGQEGGN